MLKRESKIYFQLDTELTIWIGKYVIYLLIISLTSRLRYSIGCDYGGGGWCSNIFKWAWWNRWKNMGSWWHKRLTIGQRVWTRLKAKMNVFFSAKNVRLGLATPKPNHYVFFWKITFTWVLHRSNAISENPAHLSSELLSTCRPFSETIKSLNLL